MYLHPCSYINLAEDGTNRNGTGTEKYPNEFKLGACNMQDKVIEAFPPVAKIVVDLNISIVYPTLEIWG